MSELRSVRLPPGRHRASVTVTDVSGAIRLGLACVDGRPGATSGELTLELTPGHHDHHIAGQLTRAAAAAARELGIQEIEVRFPTGDEFAIAVLTASALPWRAGPVDGSAVIDLGSDDQDQPKERP
jgi:hypothetical protein